MMAATLATLLDVAIVLILLGHLAYGYSMGILRSIGASIGAMAGAVGGYLLVPYIERISLVPTIRIIAVITVSLALVFGGRALGAWVGRTVRRQYRRARIRRGRRLRRRHLADRIVGSVVAFGVSGFVMVMLAVSIGGLGAPMVTQTLARSVTVSAMRAAVPETVKEGLAQLLSATAPDEVRTVPALGGGGAAALIDFDAENPRVNDATSSVVRVTGAAFACGFSLYGTGFVIAPERVMTNAHVVAGVTEPVVEAPGELPRVARVVHFDAALDLAVLYVPGLRADPLELDDSAGIGTQAVVAGYAHGGPLDTSAALVTDVRLALTADIYGGSRSLVEHYEFAGTVRPGDSGGPLLDLDGEVVGVVFARAADDDAVGFAIAMRHVADAAASAREASTTVGSGACVPSE